MPRLEAERSMVAPDMVGSASRPPAAAADDRATPTPIRLAALMDGWAWSGSMSPACPGVVGGAAAGRPAPGARQPAGAGRRRQRCPRPPSRTSNLLGLAVAIRFPAVARRSCAAPGPYERRSGPAGRDALVRAYVDPLRSRARWPPCGASCATPPPEPIDLGAIARRWWSCPRPTASCRRPWEEIAAHPERAVRADSRHRARGPVQAPGRLALLMRDLPATSFFLGGSGLDVRQRAADPRLGGCGVGGDLGGQDEVLAHRRLGIGAEGVPPAAQLVRRWSSGRRTCQDDRRCR